MKRLKTSLLFMVLVASALFLTGCSKEGFYQGMYYGLQQREEMVRPSDNPLPTEQPSYQTYLREREEALHCNNRNKEPALETGFSFCQPD